MNVHTIEIEQWLPIGIEEVFAFFSDAHNLNRITPVWLGFQILTPKPIPMAVGTLIDYRLKWRGIPIKWQTRIEAWDPPNRFVDCQLSGPYRKWRHEHLFEVRDGGVQIQDRVDYAIPGGVLEPVLHRILVRKDVAKIFAFRKQRINEILCQSQE